MSEPHQERKAYRFVMKSDAVETCLVLQPVDDDLTILDDGLLALDLRPGTTEEEAEALTRELNRLVSGVTYRDE